MRNPHHDHHSQTRRRCRRSIRPLLDGRFAEPPAGSGGRALAADDTVHCYDVHSCKGQSDCATAEHDCKGQNACKGHGFKAMTAGDCLAKGGTIGDLV